MCEELTKILPAVVAVVGVLLGSFVTYKANFNIKSLELKHQLNKQHIDELRKIGTEYLAEVNSAALLSLKGKSGYFDELKKSNYLLSQIELLASKEVFSYATAMFEVLLNLYSVEPNKEISGSLSDVRSKFVESLKKEIKEKT